MKIHQKLNESLQHFKGWGGKLVGDSNFVGWGGVVSLWGWVLNLGWEVSVRWGVSCEPGWCVGGGG